MPAEHCDNNNFVHFAGEKETEPVVCIYLIHGLHGTENDFDNFVKILKKEPPYDEGQDPKKKNIRVVVTTQFSGQVILAIHIIICLTFQVYWTSIMQLILLQFAIKQRPKFSIADICGSRFQVRD